MHPGKCSRLMFQVAKATLVEGGDTTFSQEKILTVDKYEIV